MRLALLQYIQCLSCGGQLTATSFQDQDGVIEAGQLSCSCGAWYPIILGVPRILPDALLESLILSRYDGFFKQHRERLPQDVQERWDHVLRQQTTQGSLKTATAESFGYEWKRFSKMFDIYRQNFLNYIQPLTERDFVGHVILDAGCGVGRHTYWAARFGAKDVIGIDLSDAVEPAEHICRELQNAHVVQADIYHLPFRDCFDDIFSIGVLHHLPDPEGGFRSLLRLLKRGGRILIWVYGRKNNGTAVYVYEPLRVITRRLPKQVLTPLCHPFAAIVHGLNRLADVLVRVPGLRALGERIPFQYYRQFPYEVKLNDAFDVLATPKSRYYPMATIRGWFDRTDLEGVQLNYLRKKSIIALGRRPTS